MDLKNELILWYNTHLQQKNMSISSSEELASGYYFLQILHTFYPKSIQLSEVYIRPKNQYEVLQNYKILSHSFARLGWKKFQPEKYCKRKEKDYLSLAQVIKKLLSVRNMKESSLHNKVDDTLDEFKGEEEVYLGNGESQRRKLRIVELEKIKRQLLSKVIAVQGQISRNEIGQQLQLVEGLKKRISAILNNKTSLN